MKKMNKVAALNNQIFTRNIANNLWHFLFVVEINSQGLHLDETGMTNIASTMRKCIFKHNNNKSQDNETGDQHQYEG